MTERIHRLRQELERLEGVAECCHPDVHDELLSLIDDVRAHLSELESTIEPDLAD
jgi:hypothetical protein